MMDQSSPTPVAATVSVIHGIPELRVSQKVRDNNNKIL